jgi:hypothetical protein
LPQDPQGLAAAGAASGVALAVAKTDSFLSSDVEWHCGQSGTLLDRTSVSNSLPHALHAYS